MHAQAFDVAVIGGGPAGLAAALEASRLGLRVLLGSAQEDHADRPCGEGIMPSGVLALRSLGLHRAVEEGRSFPGLRHVVWDAPPLETDFPSPAVAIARPALGAALGAGLTRCENVVRVHTWCTASRTGQGISVQAGPHGRFSTRVLLVADGGGARTAPWMRGTPPRPSGRFGVRARCVERRRLERVEVHVGRGCEVYLTPLPGSRVNVAVLFAHPPAGVAGPGKLLEWALARHPAAAERLGEIVTPPTSRGLARIRPRTVAEGGVFLLGDAIGRVDPILGCGVTIALRTALLAARSAAGLLAGRDPRRVERSYAAACRREVAARHVLAGALRLADRMPRLSRATVAAVARMPRARRALIRIAGGPQETSRFSLLEG